MAEREVENLHAPLTEEAIAAMSDDDLTHRFLEIAERGIVDIRTNVPLPPDVYGEWVSNTPESIAAARMNGFDVDTRYAINSATHSDGKGNPVVGDVIFMTTSVRVKQALDRARDHMFMRTHGSRRNLEEERAFTGTVKAAGLPVDYKGQPINTSIQVPVNAGEINAQIRGSE